MTGNDEEENDVYQKRAFQSLEALELSIQQYGSCKGFGLSRSFIRHKQSQAVIRGKLVCHKARSAGCPFRVNLGSKMASGAIIPYEYHINSFCLEHNHALETNTHQHAQIKLKTKMRHTHDSTRTTVSYC